MISDEEQSSLGITVYALAFAIVGLCLVLVALSSEQLIYAYSLLLTYGILIASYNFNSTFISNQLENFQPLNSATTSWFSLEFTFQSNAWLTFTENQHAFLGMIAIQCMLAFFYNSLVDELIRTLRHLHQVELDRTQQASSYFFFLLPVLFILISTPRQFLPYLPYLSTFLAGLELHVGLLSHVHLFADFFHIAWAKSWVMIHNSGLQRFLEQQWERLHVPLTLRLFWISRGAYHVALFTVPRVAQNGDSKTHTYLSYEDLVSLSKEILILGCDTHVSLLGMTSIISLLLHYVGQAFIFILGSSRMEDRYMGTMSALLFFILALQSGISGMVPVKRLHRLYCNTCLLLMAILHFVHGMVHPELLTISAGRSYSIKRHARSLCVCAFLISFSSIVIFYLCNNNSISTWLFAVIAFGIELIVKVLISLIIYGLFLIDAKMDFWEGLDDYIYYVKSTGSTIEFIFGLLLFGNGALILLFESGGTIRALMMCIHAYFNIWTQAKEGWKVFMNRRLAATKINQLPLATADQLKSYADVCAICYNELTSARVTKCRHIFHGVCLRKWLYMQDKCPLCHQAVYSSETNDACSANEN